ncbi:hypothetical protein B0H14DRAFT_2557603 [Mycena olivaceomarginata]|nr:hypothetical protein B0H14DRAFT_2557603 [Mycena olivaceomarginata]
MRRSGDRLHLMRQRWNVETLGKVRELLKLFEKPNAARKTRLDGSETVKDSENWPWRTKIRIAGVRQTRPTRVASASGGKKKNILHQFPRFTGRWYTDEEVRDTEGGKEGIEEKGEQDPSGEGTDMEGKAGRTGEARSVSGTNVGLGHWGERGGPCPEVLSRGRYSGSGGFVDEKGRGRKMRAGWDLARKVRPRASMHGQRAWADRRTPVLMDRRGCAVGGQRAVRQYETWRGGGRKQERVTPEMAKRARARRGTAATSVSGPESMQSVNRRGSMGAGDVEQRRVLSYRRRRLSSMQSVNRCRETSAALRGRSLGGAESSMLEGNDVRIWVSSILGHKSVTSASHKNLIRTGTGCIEKETRFE